MLWVFHGLNTIGQSYISAHPLGGVDACKFFISREMVYPDDALRQGLNGIVIIKCKISENGEVTGILFEGKNIEVFRDEALRLFNKIVWEPAYQNSKAIESESRLKVVFNVRKYKRWVERRGFNDLEYRNKKVDMSNTIYDAGKTDIAPQSILPDSSKLLSTYIYKHLKYPEDAYKRNLTGTVKLEFVIETSGNVSNLHVTDGVGGGCNDEATRLVKSIKWIPALKDDRLVRTWMKIDIAFTM